VGLLAASEDLPRPEALPLAGALNTTTDITVVDSDPTQLPPVRTGGTITTGDAVAPPRAPSGPRRRRRWPFVVAAIAALAAHAAGGRV
jgi:hypothetical protein